MDLKQSYLELDVVHQKTRVTRMLSQVPLRLLETGLHKDAVEVQLSSYGGGILQGDRIGLDIRCGAHAGLLLKSQANTHVYRNDKRVEAVQYINATCAEHSRVRVLPEPVVLHAGADFRQEQVWKISRSSDFVLADWIQSGRSESNEQFSFSRFESRILIQLDEKPILEEHFICRPGRDDIRSPALFGPYDLMLNIYLMGPNAESRAESLRSFADFPQIHANALPENGSPNLPPYLFAMNPLPEQGYLCRAMAVNRRVLQPLIDRLMQAEG